MKHSFAGLLSGDTEYYVVRVENPANGVVAYMGSGDSTLKAPDGAIRYSKASAANKARRLEARHKRHGLKFEAVPFTPSTARIGLGDIVYPEIGE